MQHCLDLLGWVVVSSNAACASVSTACCFHMHQHPLAESLQYIVPATKRATLLCCALPCCHMSQWQA
jgi:hypothetical protein